jgi:hypothetical protein
MNVKPLVKKILLAFEQSTTKIKYDAIYKYNDGPYKIKQLTLSFGITEYGNMINLIKNYCFKNGKYKDQFEKYISIIGVKPLTNNDDFVTLLKESAQDPIMMQVQEDAFDDMYITPAYSFCDKKQMNLNLSKLVICDSYLQSGSILSFLRNSFAEKTPDNGGDEKVWIESYCKARHNWLANNSDKLLRNTAKRMEFMLNLIDKKDWDLTQNSYTANDVVIKVN